MAEEYNVNLPTRQLELQAEQITRNLRYSKEQVRALQNQMEYDQNHLIAIEAELVSRDHEDR